MTRQQVISNDTPPRRVTTIALVLAAAVFCVYAQTLFFDWVDYDDPVYITENPHTSHGLTMEGLHSAVTDGLTFLWIPVTSVSYMLGVSLFGFHPAGQHAINFALHLASVLLVFQVFRRLTGRLMIAAIVAALFAVHPLSVEAVAWVSGRKDVLCAFFWIACLDAYLRYAEGPNFRRMLPVLLLFGLGLASKVTMMMLPLIFLVLDWHPCRRTSGRSLPARLATLSIEKVPLFVMGLLVSLMAFQLHYGTGKLRSFVDIPLGLRLANSIYVYAFYLTKLCWPAGLTIHYPYFEQGPPVLLFCGACLLLIAITVGCLFAARRMPLLLVGWLWYLIALLPTIGLARASSFLMADRYAYVPMLGIYLMLGTLVAAGADRWPLARKPLLALAAAGLALLGAAALVQTTHWRNSLALWEHAAATNPEGVLTLEGYAGALTDLGRNDEARVALEKARALGGPFAHIATTNLAGIAIGEHKWGEALTYLREVLKGKPYYQEGYKMLATMLEGAAADANDPARQAQLQREARIARLQGDIVVKQAPLPADGGKVDKELAEAYGNLANDFLIPELCDESFFLSTHAGLADPTNPRYPDLAGRALLLKGQLVEAATFFNSALNFDPAYLPALTDLARLDARLQINAGRKAFERALRDHPDNADLRAGYEKIFGPAPAADAKP